MKLRFSAQDSVYKIFSSLEKLLPGKTVYIFIEDGNPIFDNIWRGLQIKDLLESKKINYAFVPLTKSQQKYYQEAGLKIQQPSQPSYTRVKKILSWLTVASSKQKELISARRNK